MVEEKQITPTRLGVLMALLIFLCYGLTQSLVIEGVMFLGGIFIGFTKIDSNPESLEVAYRLTRALAMLSGFAISGLIVFLMTRYFAKDIVFENSLTGIALSWGTRFYLGLGLVFGAVLGAGVFLIGYYVFPVDIDPSKVMLPEVGLSIGYTQFIWLAIVLLISPLVEEFVFRGVLFAAVTRSWNWPLAAIIVTLFFTLIHLPRTIYYPPATIAIIVLGVSTLGFRMLGNSLGPAVAVHFGYNLSVVLVSNTFSGFSPQ